jgi:hypothetical protein
MRFDKLTAPSNVEGQRTCLPVRQARRIRLRSGLLAPLVLADGQIAAHNR